MVMIPWVFNGLGVYFDPIIARANFASVGAQTLCGVSRKPLISCACISCLKIHHLLNKCHENSWFLYASLCAVPRENKFYFGMPGPYGMDLNARVAAQKYPIAYNPTNDEIRLWLFLFCDYIGMELGPYRQPSKYNYIGVGKVEKLDVYLYGYGGRGLLNANTPVFYDKVGGPRDGYIESVEKFNAFLNHCGLDVVGTLKGQNYELFEFRKEYIEPGKVFVVYLPASKKWNAVQCTEIPRPGRYVIQDIDWKTMEADTTSRIGTSYAYLVGFTPIDNKYLFGRVREEISGAGGCSHSNKRQVQCGIGGVGEYFWYCPDCKKEV